MQDQAKTKAQLLAEIAQLRQEVSRLKQIETEIRASEAKFRTLYESTSDAVMVLGEKGFLDCNGATLKMFGYDTYDQFLNTHPSEQSPPTQPDGQDSLSAANENIATAMQEGINRFEWVHCRADGSVFPAEVLLTAVELEGQQVLQVVVRDITERRQVEEALAKRAVQLESLNEISLAVLGQPDAQSVYKTVTQALVDYFDMSFARIWTLEETTNDLVLQISAGEYTHTDGPHGRVPMDSDRKLAWIAKQQTPHISNDLLNDPRLDNKKWAKESKNVAFAGYPLLSGGELLGVLGMFSGQLIPDETLPLLQSLALLVGTFVNTQRLFSRLELRAQEMETVTQVSTATSTILDADTLLQKVADLTKTRFGLYHAHIYQLNDARDTLMLAAGAGDVGRQMVAEGWNISLASEKSLVARAARIRQGVIVNDTHQEPDWLPNPLLPNTRSEMAVPMIVGDRVLGVLDVQAARVDYFTDEEARIQTALAAQVAVALQNARLFEQAQRQARQEQILREVTAQVRGATDPEAVVRASLRALGDALGRPTFVRLSKPDQLPTKPDPGNGQKNDSNKKTGQTRKT